MTNNTRTHMIAAAIVAINNAGLNAYMCGEDRSWVYYTDGTNVAYCEFGSLGFKLCTSHVPNKMYGTGFAIADGLSVDDLTAEKLRSGFVTAPHWACASGIVKWRGMAAFVKAQAPMFVYELVGRDMLAPASPISSAEDDAAPGSEAATAHAMRPAPAPASTDIENITTPDREITFNVVDETGPLFENVADHLRQLIKKLVGVEGVRPDTAAMRPQLVRFERVEADAETGASAGWWVHSVAGVQSECLITDQRDQGVAFAVCHPWGTSYRIAGLHQAMQLATRFALAEMHLRAATALARAVAQETL